MKTTKYIFVFTSLLIFRTLIFAQLPTTGFAPLYVKFGNPYFYGDTGWKIESSKLYKSIDNENSWNQVSDISFPINNLGCIGFTDEQTGYIIHDKCIASTTIYYAIGIFVYKTTDGGETWEKLFSYEPSDNWQKNLAQVFLFPNDEFFFFIKPASIPHSTYFDLCNRNGELISSYSLPDLIKVDDSWVHDSYNNIQILNKLDWWRGSYYQSFHAFNRSSISYLNAWKGKQIICADPLYVIRVLSDNVLYSNTGGMSWKTLNSVSLGDKIEFEDRNHLYINEAKYDLPVKPIFNVDSTHYISFGSASFGDPPFENHVLTFTNKGPIPANITRVEVPFSDFTVTPDQFYLNVGDSIEVTLHTENNFSISFNGYLTFIHNDSLPAGFIAVNKQMSGESITTNKNELNFPNTYLADTTYSDITITNNINSDFTFSIEIINESFSCPDTIINLPANSQETITVYFHPVNPGNLNGFLNLKYNNYDIKTVTLSGSAKVPFRAKFLQGFGEPVLYMANNIPIDSSMAIIEFENLSSKINLPIKLETWPETSYFLNKDSVFLAPLNKDTINVVFKPYYPGYFSGDIPFRLKYYLNSNQFTFTGSKGEVELWEIKCIPMSDPFECCAFIEDSLKLKKSFFNYGYDHTAQLNFTIHPKYKKPSFFLNVDSMCLDPYSGKYLEITFKPFKPCVTTDTLRVWMKGYLFKEFELNGIYNIELNPDTSNFFFRTGMDSTITKKIVIYSHYNNDIRIDSTILKINPSVIDEIPTIDQFTLDRNSFKIRANRTRTISIGFSPFIPTNDSIRYDCRLLFYGLSGKILMDINFTAVSLKRTSGLDTTNNLPEELPSDYHLYYNYPNPFNSATTIKYTLPEETYVKLHVFDIAGRLIRTLEDREKTAGIYTLQWDGRNDSGQQTASGVYLVRMITGKYTKTVKVVYLK